MTVHVRNVGVEVKQMVRTLDLSTAPRLKVDRARELFLSREGVIFLDIRDEDFFKNGHIPGAVNIPLRNLATRADELPKDYEILAYCACPHEESSARAALILQRKGFSKAAALHGGIQEWEATGYAVRAGLEDVNGGAR
jgi:rhodanese-related sulfurtransferase